MYVLLPCRHEVRKVEFIAAFSALSTIYWYFYELVNESESKEGREGKGEKEEQSGRR